MPISKELEPIHEQITVVLDGLNNLEQSGKFNEDDVRHWQNKLHHIDERYREGYIEPVRQHQNQNSLLKDPYEIPGEAEVTEELNRAHEIVRKMLERIA
ncbi:hypothetical protein BC936DRAFT_138636 [Jimgerdemannia flammicorona]|uniref:Uncharacterized protein n=2 Tax=Jimgerdemannia flammicorona TaxID=994334 RepID=A0A433QT16_9FUNG|nr:hypothetical protein BC936DRAFT_138636 [Jimgerdemannia flammicorona]RUS32926.1 hypothetical protein BC938DRAFT_473763 [Jimgerdemannia flammicorona]